MRYDPTTDTYFDDGTPDVVLGSGQTAEGPVPLTPPIASQPGGASFWDDIATAGKKAADYIFTGVSQKAKDVAAGEIGKAADKMGLPNSPAAQTSRVQGFVLVGALAIVLVVLAVKAKG
jgi:hypothetical protein